MSEIDMSFVAKELLSLLKIRIVGAGKRVAVPAVKLIG